MFTHTFGEANLGHCKRKPSSNRSEKSESHANPRYGVSPAIKMLPFLTAANTKNLKYNHTH